MEAIKEEEQKYEQSQAENGVEDSFKAAHKNELEIIQNQLDGNTDEVVADAEEDAEQIEEDLETEEQIEEELETEEQIEEKEEELIEKSVADVDYETQMEELKSKIKA